MKHNPLLLLILLAPCSCTPPEARYLGMWEGGMEVSKHDPPIERAGELRGYLQLWHTKAKFALRIGNKLQTADVTGTWELKGHTVELHPNAVDLESVDEEDIAGTWYKLIDPDKMRGDLSKAVSLRISPDGLVLTSPPFAIGPLVGTLRYGKMQHSSYLGHTDLKGTGSAQH